MFDFFFFNTVDLNTLKPIVHKKVTVIALSLSLLLSFTHFLANMIFILVQLISFSIRVSYL